MANDGLLVGELARKAGTTRKALRLYETAGLVTPRRTSSGYRVYSQEALPLLAFILKARRIGFTVAEIKSIVGIRRSGRAPCRHVHELVRRKAADVERTLVELNEVRETLLGLLRSWPSLQRGPAAVCRHIESFNGPKSAKEVRSMEESVKMSLCPACTACPEVEIVGDEVRIGEDGNLAVLKASEWNVLVNLIRSGQLTTI